MKRAVALLGLLFSATHVFAADPWIVGIVAPTTGALSTVGTRQLSAVQWWAGYECERRDRGRQINLIHATTKPAPRKARPACAIYRPRRLLLLNARLRTDLAGRAVVAERPVWQRRRRTVPLCEQLRVSDQPVGPGATKAIAAYAQASGVNHIAMVAATDARVRLA